jgi:hypothetical protein
MIKELADDKVWARLTAVEQTIRNGNPFWKVEEITNEKAMEYLLLQREIWSYIYSLIEKDNKL